MSNEENQSIDYASVLADLIARRDDLNKVIAVIEPMVGKLAPRDATQFGGTAEQVRDDSFFGMGIADAAKKLLSMKKKPLNTQEITDLLKRGGMIGSGNFSGSVGVALHRVNKNDGDIVSIGRGKWGLSEWYPGKRKNKKNDTEEEKTEE